MPYAHNNNTKALYEENLNSPRRSRSPILKSWYRRLMESRETRSDLKTTRDRQSIAINYTIYTVHLVIRMQRSDISPIYIYIYTYDIYTHTWQWSYCSEGISAVWNIRMRGCSFVCTGKSKSWRDIQCVTTNVRHTSRETLARCPRVASRVTLTAESDSLRACRSIRANRGGRVTW